MDEQKQKSRDNGEVNYAAVRPKNAVYNNKQKRKPGIMQLVLSTLRRRVFMNNLRLCRRNITTDTAKSLLGFTNESIFTIKELRQAYFEAAKQCHPDVLNNRSSSNDNSSNNNSIMHDFREITDAYEHLLNGKHTTNIADNVEVITMEEEQLYRKACMLVLGIPPEIVEESKSNPMFLHWLGGNTDAAQHWRAFFSNHGGLAQKLRPPAGYLPESSNGTCKPKSENRRRRVRK